MNEADRALRDLLARCSPDTQALNVDLILERPGAAREAAEGAETAPATKRRNRHEEDEIQIALFRLIDRAIPQYPELAYAYHVPNGGKRSKGVAGRMKAMGVRPGVPDVQLDAARGPYHGLRVEMKTASGAQSATQREWMEQLRAQGYCYLICRDAAEAFRAILWYLDLGPYRKPVDAAPPAREEISDFCESIPYR